MKLGELLAHMDPGRVRELAFQFVPGAGELSEHLLAHSVESLLKSSGQVEQAIVARRPPVLALLCAILDSPEYSIDVAACRESVMGTTNSWCREVASGEILGREDQCRIYRRLLAAAWGNDLILDPSETALLGLLRKELGMTQAEHYLIMHHPDIQSFWRVDDAYEIVVQALEGHGILYLVDATLVLPEELVPHVRRAIGVLMRSHDAQRLYERMSNADLKAALGDHHLRLSGSKPERIERLVSNFAVAPRVLDVVHINDVRAIARDVRCQLSGSKDALISRLICHFELGLDHVQETVEEGPQQEARVLSREGFELMFRGLTGHQLKTLLMKHGLKHSGPKERKIESLWESHMSEESLLNTIKNADLADMLDGCGQDRRGSKEDKVAKLLTKFIATHPAPKRPSSHAPRQTDPPNDDLSVVFGLAPAEPEVDNGGIDPAP